MLEAAFWGLFAASSLLLGGLIAYAVDVPDQIQGLVLAFGAGTLISAVAYELVGEALAASEPSPLVALGFAAGAIAFYVGSIGVGRLAKASDSSPTGLSRRGRDKGIEIVLGAVLDGIPESVVLGLTLLEGNGIGIPVLVAIFVSNLPEALGASSDLRSSGTRRAQVLGLWATVAVASAIASAIGYTVLGDASAEVIASVQTFAAGAIIAMLAESMVPEAYLKAGRAVALATAFGFAVAAALSLST